jgi:putative colanic acid biosynthesis acetyltransferase WcaF
MNTDTEFPIQDGRGRPNPYSTGELVGRLLWTLVYWSLYRPMPRFLNGWHRFWLRVFGARLGRGIIVYPSARILLPWTVTVGDYAVIGDGVRVYSLGPVMIGRHTVLSMRVSLCAGTHDYTDTSMPLVRAPVVIGAGCWICAEAFVGPAVTIGDGSVVGARSVVMKDLPSHMVCVGNPCRPIKPRMMKPGGEPPRA